ncbi:MULTISPECIES: peptide MFS transporter [Streptomyces]|uniref:MFS transporter n=1 Tax=Streptomyces alfalfae TaxID=1642299 RepID=A0A7T4PGC4_9ACTN|nr:MULTISPECIES: oligopeptide:H+ symporter [Streptomyces]KUL52447.1 amino acid transporter [Streptomyces sp. NRRL S-1521]QQC89654.1 MFS transporter [Streptomyces alfalfae]QUI32093.1 MFS transporter [Streptomyces alfalfae]THC46461.1 MFS transporter [Streptomyces sp. A1499]
MASSLTKDSASTPGSEKTFFGHPRGLATLFMTEMWERYSFYGMKALLPLYLIAPGGMDMSATTATAIYSVYMSMVYLLAMPGGWMADRFWGPRKTVVIGASVVILGHITLALPSSASFFAGLALVALGSGLLKANISVMVGHLYKGPQDPRRDGGFTLFYIGINLGAFLAPLTIGTVGENVNWHFGFALAAVGMALGLAQFLLGSRHLSEQSSVISQPATDEQRRSALRTGLIWLVVAAALYTLMGVTGNFADWALMPLIIAGLVIPVAVLARMKRDKELSTLEQSKLSGYIWFFVVAAVFWMIYDQNGSTLSIFGKGSTTNNLLGFDFPTSWYQSLNPIFIMALAPVVASAWLWLNKRGKEPSTAVKFASSLTLIGISFAVFLIPLIDTANNGGKVSPMWLVAIYFIQTVGELCLSPVGLSLTTKMAPEKYSAQMMGVWFLAVTAGDSVTGLLTSPQLNVDLNNSGAVAVEAIIAVIAGFGIWTSRKKVKELMGSVN